MSENFYNTLVNSLDLSPESAKQVQKNITLLDYIDANAALKTKDLVTLQAVIGKYTTIEEDANPYTDSTAVQDLLGKGPDVEEDGILPSDDELTKTTEHGNTTEYETTSGKHVVVSDDETVPQIATDKQDAMDQISQLKKLAGIEDQEEGVTEDKHYRNPADSPMRSAALAGVSKTPTQLHKMVTPNEKPGPKPKKKRPL